MTHKQHQKSKSQKKIYQSECGNPTKIGSKKAQIAPTAKNQINRKQKFTKLKLSVNPRKLFGSTPTPKIDL